MAAVAFLTARRGAKAAAVFHPHARSRQPDMPQPARLIPAPARPLVPAFVLAAALGLPLPALSQGLTAAELWSGWQSAVASAGGQLTAQEKREGDRLVLQNVQLLPSGEGEAALRLETLTLISQADGSVGVVLPDQFPLVLDLPDEDGTAQKVVLSVTAPGLKLQILGLGQKAEFTAIGPSVSVTLDEMLPPPAAGVKTEITAALADLNLRYKHELDIPVPALDTALEVGSLHLELVGPEDGSETPLRVSADIDALRASAAGTFPPSTQVFLDTPTRADGTSDIEPFLTALADGLSVKASAEIGGLTATVTDQEAAAALTLAASSAGIALDQTVAAWQSLLTGAAMDVKPIGPDEPDTDMAFSLGEYRTALSIGLNGLTATQDWSLAYVMRDLVASPGVWAAIDPSGVLPAAPINTMALDLKGRYALDPVALTPGWSPLPSDPPPFTAFSFEINELALDGLGLTFNGTGGLGLDFGDLTTFEGFPLPAGRLHFVTVGAYGLLDKLSSIGLVSADDMSGARMLLLMAGKAGAEPDHLTTDLDFRDKSLFLNGQKIR